MIRQKQDLKVILLVLFVSLFVFSCASPTEPGPELIEVEPAAVEEVVEEAAEIVEEIEEVKEVIEEVVEEPAEEIEAVEAEAEAEVEEAVEAEVEEVVEAEEAAESEEEAMAEAEEAEPEMVAIVSPNDYQQIGQTGRPQFINSYADW